MLKTIPGYHISESRHVSAAGTEYFAIHLASGRPVCVFCEPLNNDEVCLSELEQAELLAGREVLTGLQHPHLVPVYESSIAEGQLCTVSGHVAGQSLAELSGQLCVLDLIYLVRQVASALDYLAECGLPLVSVNAHQVVLSASDGKAWLASWTGSLSDKATEQGRQDLYSLGLLFYNLLLDESDLAALPPIMTARRQMPTNSIELYTIEMPDDRKLFQRFVNKALAVDPAMRFQSGAELVAALDELDDEEIIKINRTRGMSVAEQVPEPESAASELTSAQVLSLKPAVLPEPVTEIQATSQAPVPAPKPAQSVNIAREVERMCADEKNAVASRKQVVAEGRARRPLLLLTLLLALLVYYNAEQAVDPLSFAQWVESVGKDPSPTLLP